MIMRSRCASVGKNMESSDRLKSCVRYLVLVPCLMGLAATFMRNRAEYLSGRTSTSSSWKYEPGGYKYPYFVFCPDEPFEDMNKYNPHVNATEFRRKAKDVKVYFSNLGLYESDTDDAAERPEEREVVTQYNGVCKGFLIKGKYPHMTTAVFKLSPGPGGEVLFFLRTPLEEAFMSFQVLSPSAFFTRVGPGETMVQIVYELFLMKSRGNTGDAGVGCSEEWTYERHYECVLGELAAALSSSGHSRCLPASLQAPLAPHINATSDPSCSSSDFSSATAVTNEFMYRSLPRLSSCPPPCAKTGMDMTELPVHSSIANGEESERTVFVRIPTAFVQVQEEYYVFTFLTLLTSCGGAMGLFVGWSLFELRLPVEAAVDIVARRSRVKGAIAAKFDLRRKLQSAGKARV